VILVDSSVWIDYFNGSDTAETDYLDTVLQSDLICIGDMILGEVLQGFRQERHFKIARDLLVNLPVHQLLNPTLALRGASHYRSLRKRGITVRKSVDVWIATFCIENRLPLLFSGRDFLPFVRHLQLATPLRYEG